MSFHLSDEDLQRYLDRQLNYQEERQFTGHLMECQTCQKELKYYQEIYTFLQDEPDFPLSPGFDQALLSHLNQQKKIRYFPIDFDNLATILGFFLFSVFLIYFCDYHSFTRSLLNFFPYLNHLWNLLKITFTAIPGFLKSDYMMVIVFILIVLSFFEEHFLRKQNKFFLL